MPSDAPINLFIFFKQVTQCEPHYCRRAGRMTTAIKDLGDFRKDVRNKDDFKEALAQKGIAILGGKRGRSGFQKMLASR